MLKTMEISGARIAPIEPEGVAAQTQFFQRSILVHVLGLSADDGAWVQVTLNPGQAWFLSSSSLQENAQGREIVGDLAN